MCLTCGILLIISTQLFKAAALSATTQALCFTVPGTAWFVERLTRPASFVPPRVRSGVGSEADDTPAFRLAVLPPSRLPVQGRHRRQGIGRRRGGHHRSAQQAATLPGMT